MKEKAIKEKERLIDLILKLRQKCNLEDQITNTFNLTNRELSCICAIRPDESVPLCEISKRVNLSPSRASRLINSLIRKKFLNPSEDSEDKRFLILSLSQNGKKCIKVMEDQKESCEKKMMDKIDNNKVDTLRNVISDLINIL
jgi:DNA-binding MarR family transcriptional regulator